MGMLRRIFLPFVAAVFMTGSAKAADIETAPDYDWSGFYVGATAGYGWADADFDLDLGGDWLSLIADPVARDQFADSLGGKLHPQGFVGGLKAGWNTQFDNLLFGIEGDISYADLDDDDSEAFFSNRKEAELSWISTLRARTGFTFDQALIYATGGLAAGDWHVRQRLEDLVGNGADFDESEWQFGWVIGGGVELALSESWSINAEYLYFDFGKIDGDTFLDQTPSFTQVHDVDLTAQVVRAGISYRFGY